MVKMRWNQLPLVQATCPQVICLPCRSKTLQNVDIQCSPDIHSIADIEKFSDRILEAEKICDKQEMEQFPNEGDDIQVIHHGADILQYCTADRNVPVYFFSYTGIFSHRYITSISKFFFSSGKIQICC